MNQHFLENVGKIHSRYTEVFGPFVYGLCKAIQPKFVIETGTAQGYLTAWLGLYGVESGNKVITIDWNVESYPHGFPGSTEQVRKNLEACGVENGVIIVEHEALALLQQMAISGRLNGLQMLILDDYHTYEHLTAEIDTVYPYLVTGGYILVHDVTHGALPEIHNAVIAAINKYKFKNIWLFNSLGYCILQKEWQLSILI